jgi:hypothetical protein
MNIPNDTGHPWRLNKFVEYQHKVPPINPVTCMEYIKLKDLGYDDCVYLSWLVSITYNAITAIFIFEQLSWRKAKRSLVEQFWWKYKENLIFNSARIYVKSNDWFVDLVYDFLLTVEKKPFAWLKSIAKHKSTEKNCEVIFKEVKRFKNVGRFSADLFVEMIIHCTVNKHLKLNLSFSEKMDLKSCSNITSGLLNMFYRDDEANEFDKTKKLKSEDIEELENNLLEVQKAIQKRYPNSVSALEVFTPKICSYRNLYKGRRYGGFHHDRQLETLDKYINNYPKLKLWKLLFKIRSNVFSKNLLGEKNDWRGIRKRRNKLFLEEGLTGVEVIS